LYQIFVEVIASRFVLFVFTSKFLQSTLFS